jgi:hypothetical protein
MGAGEKPVIRMFRRLNVPATESQLGLALVVASVTMGLMLCAIVWQSNIIGNQRDVIQWLWSTKFGG